MLHEVCSIVKLISCICFGNFLLMGFYVFLLVVCQMRCTQLMHSWHAKWKENMRRLIRIPRCSINLQYKVSDIAKEDSLVCISLLSPFDADLVIHIQSNIIVHLWFWFRKTIFFEKSKGTTIPYFILHAFQTGARG